ncbi:hypothetical protein Tsubulata_021949 [Turnera subulata]|uniref:NB-ARC domain-containing protein n=1 Tax=Turnera subulata TaxID=218843 RepID=A0A9Q0FDP1_9ROSI|nr:hypothetical protein Tsubulata_021949 [Turnera subulata]
MPFSILKTFLTFTVINNHYFLHQATVLICRGLNFVDLTPPQPARTPGTASSSSCLRRSSSNCLHGRRSSNKTYLRSAMALAAGESSGLVSEADDHITDTFFNQKIFDKNILKNLKTTLTSIVKLLNEAGEAQVTDPDVKEWLYDVKQAVYEAEDLLEAMGSAHTFKKKVMRKFFPSLLPGKERTKMHEMQSDLESILKKLIDLLGRKDTLALIEKIGGQASQPRQPTISWMVSNFYGREKDLEDIVKSVLSEDANHKCIPIIGFGGIGKTTLAQAVYNDKRVEEKFRDRKGWVSVSEETDIDKVAKHVLEDLDWSVASNALTPNKLHVKLKQVMSKDKYLLVLDDVWYDNREAWGKFLDPLLNASSPASKIIVTTRNETVSSIFSASRAPYRLDELEEDACWSVFAFHAFRGENPRARDPRLETIGKEIARNCKGSPLVAGVLGGVLQSSRDIRKWRETLESRKAILALQQLLTTLHFFSFIL